MSTLVELFKAGGIQSDGIHNAKYDTDKGDMLPNHHNYLPTYDKLFAPYKDQEINIFEVGYLAGGSARLMEDYFPKATIYTIDVNSYAPCEQNLYSDSPDPKGRIKMELRDIRTMTSDDFIGREPTIAIDDGSHKAEDQLYFIKIIWPILKPGGLLIVEDIQHIDAHLSAFAAFGIPFEIIDLRYKTKQSRYDNILLVFRKPNE